MKKMLLSMTVALSFAGLPMLAGCDREVSREQKVTHSPDGRTTVEEKKTVEKSDGTVETSREKKTVDNK